MRSTFVTLAMLSIALAGCNTVEVSEGSLSSSQRVAFVSSRGDGLTPPATAVFFEDRPGHFVPVSTGYGQAVVPIVMGSVAGGATLGIGNIIAARQIRPSRTVVTATATGGNGPVNSNNNNNSGNVTGDGNIGRDNVIGNDNGSGNNSNNNNNIAVLGNP